MYSLRQPLTTWSVFSVDTQAVTRRTSERGLPCLCLQALGFNCVRLPFSFADLYSDPPVNQDSFIADCALPTVQQIADSLTPPGLPAKLASASGSSSNTAITAQQQLQEFAAGAGSQPFTCNAAFNTSGPATVDRFVYAADAIARQGMYVVIADELTIDPLAVVNSPVSAALRVRCCLVSGLTKSATHVSLLRRQRS